MKDEQTSDRGEPFKALIAASSLIVALLYLAGFAFRWSYYYNFGVQHLVFNLSLQAILTASMEMVKQPLNFLLTVVGLGGSLLLVGALIRILRHISQSQNPKKIWKPFVLIARSYVRTPLLTDCTRALVVFYVVYMLSSQMGLMQFKKHIVNSRNNSLPVVTAIAEGDQSLVLACGTDWNSATSFVGDGKLAREILEYHRTCTDENTKWRLLYRDDKSIYLFASETDPTGRPLTLVLPNTEKIILVME